MDLTIIDIVSDMRSCVTYFKFHYTERASISFLIVHLLHDFFLHRFILFYYYFFFFEHIDGVILGLLLNGD